MELSADVVRNVDFRERRYGYHPEDVDKFLEDLAVAIEAHLAKSSRTSVALSSAKAESIAIASDDTLQRTMLLAQRAADTAIREAQERATQIVVDAKEEARAIMVKAEDAAHRFRGRHATET